MDYREDRRPRRERALRGQGSTGGFSMAETLATVAIVVILLALAVVGIFNLYYSLQQKELDSKAEIIYVAAQDQMTKIMAAGQKTLMDPKTSSSESTLITGVPSDARDEDLAEDTDDPNTNYIKKGSLAYLTSEQLRTGSQYSSLNAASLLFGDGGLDDELLNENWIIEYDVSSLTVYAVFFNPSDSDFVDGYVDEASSGGNGGYNGYRAYSDRLESLKSHSKTIGYHGGAGSAASSDSHNLSLSVNIVNKEKLVANIVCDKPAALTDDDIAFRVDVTDAQDNTFRTYYTIDDALTDQSGGCKVVHTPAADSSATDALYKSGYRYSLKLTLDSLESGASKRFTTLYGSGHTEAVETTEYNKKLVEGSDVTVSVVAFCPTNKTVQSISDSDTENSLFASVEGDTAHIVYGRHLQNLDSSSGADKSTLTKAVQDRDIDFTQVENNTADEYEDWFNTYGGGKYFNTNKDFSSDIPLFKPISNGRLVSYDGQSKEIKHLYVKTEGSATSGLAALFDLLRSGRDLKLQNINLASPSVKCLQSGSSSGSGNGNVGALVSQTEGNLSISDCQVYLLEEDRKADSQTYAWMQGINVGGLVGYVSSGKVSITRSSASTVIGDTSSAGPSSMTTIGGLVGSVDNGGSVTIESSYSDSYLMGATVGGLVGSASRGAASSTPVSINNSYAAGFLAWGSRGAGILANGSGNSISKTYSVMDILSEEKAAGYKSPDAFASVAASDSATLSDCFYLQDVSGDIAQSTAGSTGVSDNNSGHAKVKSALIDKNKGTPFVADAGSEPYNLMSQGLSPDSYDWPTIGGLKHLGDWAAGFKAGSLIYYEKYLGGEQKYGFDGANVTKTLRDDARDNEKKRFSVVGDGYGVVYKKGQKPSAKVTVTVVKPNGTSAGVYDLDATSSPYVVNDEYEIYPLPASITNAEKGNGNNFFFKATIDIEGGSSTTFCFNPHFARTVRGPVSSDASAPSLGQTAYLRSARQLYNLSRYYNDYRDVAEGRTFSQERNIDYDEYEWTDNNFAGLEKKVTAQEPIGVSSQESFKAHYDGNHHEITNVSFETGEGKTCAGLFGSVSAGSTIKNVVLCTDYDPSEEHKNKKFYVKCTDTLSGNINAYLGVLAGYNAGTIENCAVSGYYIADSTGTIHAYTNSRVHVGGFVGANKGKIVDCSADSPRLRLSALFSDVCAAGFVGTNLSGARIQNSYALGAVELTDAKGGKVSIAGFAGKNEGRITSSYTATALSVSGEGAQSYGFAPVGGYVSSDCRYLNGGTYSYLQKMYSYNFRTALSSGKPATYDELKEASADGPVDENHTFYYYNTDTNLKAYPYRGVVKNADGDYAHYGDWQDDVRLGTLGVFYWEHEEHGSNDGYHMTYLGTRADYVNGVQKDTLEQGSSLCTAHDDGGVITSYGYGFYVQGGEDVKAAWDGINCSSGASVDASSISNYNRAVSKNLQDQLTNTGVVDDNYAFYAFTTRTENEASGADYIVLDRSSMNGTSINKDAQNGYLTLGLMSKNGGTTKQLRNYRFEISPFFANALSINSVDYDESAELVTAAQSSPLEASDGMLSDYSKKPGKTETTVANGKQTAGNAYEIRSLDQLQYINWNSESKSTDKLSEKGNYQNFNYLMYPDQTEVAGSNQRGSVEKVASKSMARKDLYWTQTHDIAPAADDANFSPIAGTYESSSVTKSSGGYNARVYSWFGGTYNGQSYTVKNIEIVSNSFNVGLFGTTVGANIRNVIMYSDDPAHSVIRQEQNGNDKAGAYSIGGLIGVAFDYVVDAEALKNSSNAITNCAISGYSITDKSSNQMGLGEVNVGGLIGVANVNLRQCSANVAITEQATFSNGVAEFGAFIRVGGLCGGAQGNVTDCYTGGSFDFNEDIAQSLKWTSETNRNEKRFLISVGGIAGSAFTSNYINLTGSSDVRDGSPVFTSCYTYFDFPQHGIKEAPDSKETTLIMSTIASRADRANRTESTSGTVTIGEGCYYYDQITKTNANVEEQYRGKDAVNKTIGSPMGISYEAMSSTGGDSFVDKLNSAEKSSKSWSWVTTEDAGGAIDGKFSFPSANVALEGKNYPFPAIVTQNDLTFGTVSEPETVHVHYGDWPLADASYWEQGRGSIDIFADRSGGAASLAAKTFKLHVNSKDFVGSVSADSFEIDEKEKGIVRVKDVSGGENGVYNVTFEALQEGSVTVTLKDTSAKISLQVTANLDLSVSLDANSPGELRENPYTLVLDTGSGSAAHLTLGAKSGTVDCNIMIDSWSWTNDPDGQTIVTPTFDESNTRLMTVTRADSGTALLAIDANYTYNDKTYSKQLYLNVVDPGVLGVSNGTAFNEVKNNGKEEQGVDKAYPSSEEKPSYALGADESFYLYSASDDSYLDDANHIASVTISSGTKSTVCKPGKYGQGEDYYVSFADKTVVSGPFKYLAGKIAYLGEETSKPKTVTIAVTLSDGSTLRCELSGGVLQTTGVSTLTFKSGAGDGASAKTFRFPNGYKYEFDDYTGIFGSGGTTFDEWQKGSDEFFSKGDALTVSADATFVATYKKTLTLSLKNGASSLTQLILVGRKGVEGIGEMDNAAAKNLFAQYRLDGWYDGTSTSPKKVANADGSLAADGSYADGAIKLSDGVLTMSADATLYAAKATWSLASAIEDGRDYLIANSNTVTQGGRLMLAASGEIEDENAIADSEFASEAVPKSSVYKLMPSTISVDDVSSPVISSRVDDTAVWHASAKGNYEGDTSIDYFAFYNIGTGLTLMDTGAKQGSSGWWYLGGIEDVANCGGLTIDEKPYDNHWRCDFTLDSKSKTLRTFNKPGSNKNVRFSSSNSAVLFAEKGGDSNTYLYAKNLEFDWS